MFVSLSLPRVEGADLRPWVPPEHSLVISSVHDAPQQPQPGEGEDGGGNAMGSASLLTLEWEAASQMAQQKLQVPPGFLAGRELLSGLLWFSTVWLTSATGQGAFLEPRPEANLCAS